MMHTLRGWRTAVATLVASFALLWSVPAAQAQDDFQWVQQLGNNQNSTATAVAVSPAGEIFVAGLFRGEVDFDPGPGETILNAGSAESSYIAKFGPASNLIWARVLKGSERVAINDIVVDGMNQIGVVGGFRGEADLDPGPGVFSVESKGSDDIFLLRLLPDGSLDWGWVGGDSASDAGIAVATDADHSLYVTGDYEGTMFVESNSPSFEMNSEGEDDVFAARFSNSGTLLWVRSFGGSDDESPTDIALDADKNVYITGTFEGEADLDPTHTSIDLKSYGNKDVFVTILNVNGNWLWSTQLGGTGGDRNPRILAQPNGDFYVAGEFEGIGDFDRLGAGGVIHSRGEHDLFVAHYHSRNLVRKDFQWVFGIGNELTDQLSAIDQDSFGSVYLMGVFKGTVDFDPTANQNLLTSSGSDDIFLARYSQQGALSQLRNLMNPQDDQPSALALDNNDNLIVAGEFRGTIDLGNGLSVSTGQPEDVYNVFLARYRRDTFVPLPLRAYLPGIVQEQAAR